MTPAPPRTPAGTRDWADHGTGLLLAGLDALAETDLDRSTALPGWTRRHLLAHVRSNADAIGRLVTWACTGVETLMYAGPEQRAAEIETGARRPDLRALVHASARSLAQAWDDLPAGAWSTPVRTAQGRVVPAAETVWMRAREVCIHATDLDVGIDFADLPEPFLVALLDDVAAWRSQRPGPGLVLTTQRTRHVLAGDGTATAVDLDVATAAAWLVGRHHDSRLPALPGWL